MLAETPHGDVQRAIGLLADLRSDGAAVDGEAVDVRALAGHLASASALGGGGRMWTAYTPPFGSLGDGSK